MITLLNFNLAQDIGKKKAEPRTPHFFSLNQDIVPWSQKEKCRVCNLHFPKQKGRAIADSTFTRFLSKSNHSDVYHFLGKIRVPVTSTMRSLLVSSLV
jgi:hypothetical protein